MAAERQRTKAPPDLECSSPRVALVSSYLSLPHFTLKFEKGFSVLAGCFLPDSQGSLPRGPAPSCGDLLSSAGRHMEVLSALLLLSSLFFAVTSFENIRELLQAKTHRPPTENGEPLEVRLGIFLESLGNFRSTEMTFDVDLYVYMSWLDLRLKHQGPDYVMVNDDAARKRLWLPDLYFANARQATFQTVTRPNFNLFIAPDGQIAYSCRCTLTVACSLDLRMYPMDHQVCSIRVLSYAHIASQVNVSWFEENAISVNPEVGLPEFKITALRKDYCNGTYRYALMPNSSKLDNFSCLSGKIYLSRSLGYNLLQSYIPTSLIVMISWVSFWIDRRAVPARVTLSFTTLVSFTTLGSGLRFGLAQVSYAKALDLWYGACLMFVFMALLEFALINNYMRKAEKFDHFAKKLQETLKKKLEKQKKANAVGATTMEKSPLFERKQQVSYETDPLEDFESSWGELFQNKTKLTGNYEEDSIPYCLATSRGHSRRALAIDQGCRVLFPVAFMLFNAIYWSYYLVYVRPDYY